MRILLIPRFIADECILVLWYMVYVCTRLPQTYVSSAMREQSIEIYYIAATTIHRTIINIYMRVCLCQTFNWQPYQITGSLLHRRSLEKVEFELRSEW